MENFIFCAVWIILEQYILILINSHVAICPWLQIKAITLHEKRLNMDVIGKSLNKF